MQTALTERLVEAAKLELARTLAGLCREVDAAESSILLPQDDTDLVFFASSNPALMQPGAPLVPIMASFTGIAFRTGQTIAVADAASQASHYKAVDELVGSRTREFAAIPFGEPTVLGVLTLVNRPSRTQGETRPFALAELRKAEAFGGELARALAPIIGLTGSAAQGGDLAQRLGAEFATDLAQLDEPERRIVRALVGALIQNRSE
jgi:hypothetical protein